MGGWVGGWARWVRGLVVGKGGCRKLGGKLGVGWGATQNSELSKNGLCACVSLRHGICRGAEIVGRLLR